VTAQPGGHSCRSSTGTHCQITGLTNGTAYTLTVVTTTVDGTSPPCAANAPVTPQSPPDPPTGVTVAAADAVLNVSWDGPASPGSLPITGYRAVAAPGNSSCTAGPGTGCTIGGLTNGTTYTVTVVASSTAGDSRPALAASAGTPGAPDLPDKLPAADDGLATSAGSTLIAGAATTLTGAGFAAGTPVVIGLYGTGGPRQLAATASDGSGDLTSDITLPQDLTGTYRLVARGYASGGQMRTLGVSMIMSAPPVGHSLGLLVTVVACGALLFLGGFILLVLALRGRLPGVGSQVLVGR
jgi:hypothetical protein